jgi:hypothetical protein
MRVWHGRIEQLHLQADDRTQPRFLGRRHEADRAVEALVIGQREGRQAKFDRSGHQVLGGRGTVEEREVRVAVEFGVRA